MGTLAGFKRGAGFRRRQVRATPAALTDPSITAGIGLAVAELGGAAAGLAGALRLKQEKRNIELAKTDLNSMIADTASARNEFLQTLRTTDASYDEINKMWGDFKKKTFKKIGNTSKQKKAQKAYGEYIRGTIPAWDQDIDNIAWGVSVPRARTKLFNSTVEILRSAPDFNTALLEAGMAIEESNLLTSEEKDLTLANAVIETNPQWYLDNVDAEKTKELFNLLTPDQKTALETKARSEISRIRVEQQRALQGLNDETRKTASELWRKNELTANWLETNRDNMAASDYERYNSHLIAKANAEKSFQANLAKIEDPYNRDIFGKLDAANTNEQLDALQDVVNDNVEQKKISVADGDKWTGKIDAKRQEQTFTKADAYPEWARLSDEITKVQANPTKEAIENVNRMIDRAVIPPPGQEAKLTPELAISLRGRVDGIERNPEVKKRPSLARAHAAMGRLRTLQVGLLTQKEPVTPQFLRVQREIISERKIAEEGLSPDEIIIDVEISFTRMAAELDEYADTIAGDKDFDDKINKKLQDLTEPFVIKAIVDEVELTTREKIFSPKKEGIFSRFLRTEDEELIQERTQLLKKQDEYKKLTTAEKKSAINLIEGGLTVNQAIAEVTPKITTQAQYDAIPSGTIFIDTDGTKVRKK